MLRRLTPEMDRLIAVSRSIVGQDPRRRALGPPVQMIYNGVDLERYDHQEACCTLPEEYGFEPGSPMVGVVARLEPEKGHPTLLEAWPLVLERVPEARLLIIGEGSRREALEAQARELDLLGEECSGDACVGTRHARPGARVVFTGRRDDVPAVTAALDVAVLPSYREAQGLVILEAMALSRPVVASRVGGIPEMIEDGVTGPARPAARSGRAGRGHHPPAARPSAGRHHRARRPRRRPRALLRRARWSARSRTSTTRAPARSVIAPRQPRACPPSPRRDLGQGRTTPQ